MDSTTLASGVNENNQQSPRKILISGGAGFLGNHLCKRLVDAGNQVICFDNFFTGRISNVKHLLKTKRFKLIEHDINEFLDVEVDQIYHLACPASPIHYQSDPVFTAKTSVLGSLNMLQLAASYKIPILLASTSEVYGDPLQNPQKESYRGNVNQIGIRGCYDEGKRMMECLAMDFKRTKNVDVKIVRIFNTYGPNMNLDDGRVISNFIKQALTDQPLTVYGNGLQTRSFCFYDDLIQALELMMACPNFSGPVNLGADSQITVKELAELIIELTNSKSEIHEKNLPADDPKQRLPDITLAKEKLNWQPKTTLHDGLIKTIAYFKQVLQAV